MNNAAKWIAAVVMVIVFFPVMLAGFLWRNAVDFFDVGYYRWTAAAARWIR